MNIEELAQVLQQDFCTLEQDYYTTKVIRSGDYLEVTEYNVPVPEGKTGTATTKRTGRRNYTIDDESKAHNAKLSARRAKERMFRLCMSNFDIHGTDEIGFFTLTFDQSRFDATKMRLCQNRFNSWTKNMRAIFPDFKYVAVREFSNPQSSVFHYHVLCNVELEDDELSELWKRGICDAKRVKRDHQSIEKLVDYMSKDFTNSRLGNSRRYLQSKNLRKPEVLKKKEKPKQLDLLQFMLDDAVVLNNYSVERYGEVILTKSTYRTNHASRDVPLD